ncbi:unnamed protein product [Rotaria socialis]|uniref:Uncharacterized protein n=1 Tax=Rotaria socialis TaxID=392032 RepID=A0A817QWF2_9BILA|nr:unnamed protein product [Rotaria socialis]
MIRIDHVFRWHTSTLAHAQMSAHERELYTPMQNHLKEHQYVFILLFHNLLNINNIFVCVYRGAVPIDIAPKACLVQSQVKRIATNATAR